MIRSMAAFSMGGLLAASVALAGCSAVEKTGEVGNKNLRPYTANDHEKHGLPLNGVHSIDSPTYRLRSADDRYNHQDTWMLRNRMGNNMIGAHGNDRLEMDEGMARRLKALPGVKEAYVLRAGERAYVGIRENRQGQRPSRTAEVNPELRSRIIQRIQKASSTAREVYVTSNPEYLARMEMYRDAADSGHPVGEFTAEFNALAARIFPAVTYKDTAETRFPADRRP